MSDAPTLPEVDRQLERGMLFVHTVLADQACRANESEALVNGLVDLLVKRGLVETEELTAAVEAAQAEAAEEGRLATVGVAIRIDGEDAAVNVEVNCEERLPICKAVCCRLHFALSAEEIESGPMKWDLGRPYFNRRNEDGYCHQIDGQLACSVYNERPPVCRRYNCAGDSRIWKDFDAMELNQDWIDANLGGDAPNLMEMLMDAGQSV